MNKEIVLSALPNINRENLYEFFPKLNFEDSNELKGYSWEEWHIGSLGAGDLYLAAEMARLLDLKPGMKVLELGAGRCRSSVFLAKHYGVKVIAADISSDPTDNWKVVIEKSMEDNVIPIKMDARNIVFPDNYFDAVFSLNAYMYFGTDDLYLPYLLRFVKKTGKICISSPCYSHEIDDNTSKDFLFDTPEYLESYSIHSPKWWENHFKKMSLVDVTYCKEHEKGREIWLDSMRWQLESGRDVKDFQQDIKMLIKDDKRFITYFTLAANKR